MLLTILNTQRTAKSLRSRVKRRPILVSGLAGIPRSLRWRYHALLAPLWSLQLQAVVSALLSGWLYRETLNRLRFLVHNCQYTALVGFH